MARRKNDFYPTPAWATEVLLEHCPIPRDSHVYEPCVGAGDIVDVLRNNLFETIYTNDIDRSRVADTHRDAATEAGWGIKMLDWTITNPPFNQAYQILTRAMEHSGQGVAMLLRLSFLEPTYERGDWLAANPPDKLIVLPRISFTGDGKTDSVTAAWFVWVKKNPKRSAIVVQPKTS